MMSGAEETATIKLRVEDERYAHIDQCFQHYRNHAEAGGVPDRVPRFRAGEQGRANVTAALHRQYREIVLETEPMMRAETVQRSAGEGEIDGAGREASPQPAQGRPALRRERGALHAPIDRGSPSTVMPASRWTARTKWRPVGVSNPCSQRERLVSWATRRTGQRW